MALSFGHEKKSWETETKIGFKLRVFSLVWVFCVYTLGAGTLDSSLQYW